MPKNTHPISELPPPRPEQRGWVYLSAIILVIVIVQWFFPDQLPDTIFMHLTFGLAVGIPAGGFAGWSVNGLINRMQGKVKPARPW